MATGQILQAKAFRNPLGYRSFPWSGWTHDSSSEQLGHVFLTNTGWDGLGEKKNTPGCTNDSLSSLCVRRGSKYLFIKQVQKPWWFLNVSFRCKCQCVCGVCGSSGRADSLCAHWCCPALWLGSTQNALFLFSPFKPLKDTLHPSTSWRTDTFLWRMNEGVSTTPYFFLRTSSRKNADEWFARTLRGKLVTVVFILYTSDKQQLSPGTFSHCSFPYERGKCDYIRYSLQT